MACAKAGAPAIRAVLLDLSGTVHIGDQVIPGAQEACQKLVLENIKIKFLTNTTKSSRDELLEQLWKMGFPKDTVNSDNLVTNSQPAKQTIQYHNLRPYCLIQASLLEDLKLPQLIPEVASGASCEFFNSVLVGLAPEAFYYERLNQAFRVLMKEKERRKVIPEMDKANAPPLIIALHRGKYLRDTDGGLSLGPGGFVACLQEAAGIDDKDIVVMGKPSQDFFHAAIPDGISPSETAMIGDDVRQDIIGAKRAGLGMGILVRTGKYQAGDESVEEGRCAPDAVTNSLVEAVDYILKTKLN